MNNLFDGDDLPPVIDESKDYLVELVGDGKKFKSPQELARGKFESDMYIKTLERQLDGIREDYIKTKEESMSRAKLEDLIDQLSKSKISSENNPSANDLSSPPQLDETKLKSLVSSEVRELRESEKQEANFSLVKERLMAKYGDRYRDVMKEQIAELGITADELNNMARKQPKVLLKTLGLDQAPSNQQFQAPPRSNTLTDSFKPKVEKRTWSWYQNLKKTDPKRYYDPRTNVQMHNDAISLGTEFGDGDFNR